MEMYLDKKLSPEKRAKDLLNRLTIKEKVEQLNCFLPTIENRKPPQNQVYGQVSAFGIREINDLEQAINFQREVQQEMIKRSRFNIPALMHMEGVNGAYIQGSTSFPSPLGRGATFNPKLEREIGKIVGVEERALGIPLTLAPVLDIARDPRMGRYGEAYSEDPTLTAKMGVEFTKGIQQSSSNMTTHGVAKHFVASQNSLGGIHGADLTLPINTIKENHAKPFQAAIAEANLKGIMPCYSAFNGKSTHTSKAILKGLLIDEMRFDGLVVSDYCGISNAHDVHKQYADVVTAGIEALKAGVDIELHQIISFNEEFTRRFESGEEDIEPLDRAVFNVLKAKFETGTFDNPFSLSKEEVLEVQRNVDKNISLQCAQESLVLLKNDGILPLANENIKKIAVIGKHAKSARNFFGGYTHLSMAEGIRAAKKSMAGLVDGKESTYPKIAKTDVQEDDFPNFEEVLKFQNSSCRSLIEELTLRYDDVSYEFGYQTIGDDESDFISALKLIESSDVAILTLGGKHGTSSIATMGEGVDATSINLPKCQERFIDIASQLGKPLIGVHFDGRPISSDIADEKLNAIIEAWNPSEFGAQAIVDVISGEINPSGKMPVSTLYNAGQVPLYYNHPWGSAYTQGESVGFPNYVDCSHHPRYPFGYGLSYTEYKYSNIVLNETGNSFFVECDVENIGEKNGSESVQLYFSLTQTSMNRPNIELVGFEKVQLNSNEKKRVRFEVEKTVFSFVDEMGSWIQEKGHIKFMIGPNSRDITLDVSCEILSTKEIDCTKRSFYAVSSIKEN